MVTAYIYLKFRDRIYMVDDKWCVNVDKEDIFFMWEEGNFNCDCNKSLFIRRQVDDKFPELPCGDRIELVKIKIKGKTQTTKNYIPM